MLCAGADFAVLPFTGIRLFEMCAVESKSQLSTEVTVNVMSPDVKEDAAMSWLQQHCMW